MKSVASVGEFGLIERIARLVPGSPAVIEGIGDDCAIVRFHDRQLLLSCDLSIEDVHFRRRYLEPEDIGWRAAAAGLSDIAAMGGSPMFGLIGLACPADTEVAWIQGIYQGLAKVMSRHGASIVGGDTTCNPSGTVIDVVVVGEPTRKRTLRRTGASAGDYLAVTGPVGLAAGGLHALENGHTAPELVRAFSQPDPRIPEGQWLCQHPAVHAMMDVTDGLVQDAGHMSAASGFGVDIHPEWLAIHPALADYCRGLGLQATDWVLGGGEDYELLFAVDPAEWDALREAYANEFRAEVQAVGAFTDAWAGIRIDGEPAHVPGYDHFGTAHAD